MAYFSREETLVDPFGRVPEALVNSSARTLIGRKYKSSESWMSFFTVAKNRPEEEFRLTSIFGALM
jgi:hypothetical protein